MSVDGLNSKTYNEIESCDIDYRDGSNESEGWCSLKFFILIVLEVIWNPKMKPYISDKKNGIPLCMGQLENGFFRKSLIETLKTSTQW